MKSSILCYAIACCLTLWFTDAAAQTGRWISLFDGKTLSGWKASENEPSFRVEDGCIVQEGPRSHLYYMGDVGSHVFKNFEFKAQVYTFENANSGVYFHTRFQENGFPNYGYEVQVNNSHRDAIRTGSLYNVVDIADKYAIDGEWFELYIKVVGNHVIIKVNGTTVVDYTQMTDKSRLVRKDDHFGRYVESGTFAIQAHDPGSKVKYKDIQVKILD
ncbi:3-keto-disaccharide hydrolase [Parapedobacter pyrenivorans]|uniref:3-keto-disaccharide hydrolase n=1 Tax=Parapedobacter pyrenivorans TaxID=1305674 RepID=UPI00333E7CA3